MEFTKKIRLLVVSLILLSGCTTSKVNRTLSDILHEAEETTMPEAEYNKKYYSYYITPEIGRQTSTPCGNVFVYE